MANPSPICNNVTETCTNSAHPDEISHYGIMQKNSFIEACIGVLGIQDICHFTSRDIEYYPFYFQGYRILCSIFLLLPGILDI